MRKFLFIILMFVALIAEAVPANSLRVAIADGDPVSFLFDEQPELTFVGSTLQIKSASRSAVIELDKVVDITMAFAQESSVDAVAKPSIAMQMLADGVQFSGIADGSTVCVADLTGRSYRCEVVDGAFVLSRNVLPKGMYIVRINNFTAKVNL